MKTKFILRSKRIQYSVIILAQYLSIFILAPEKSPDILLDFNLFLLVFASSLTIASGYIINNFYDSQKT
jgi:4-hydroxybenzoate polyprenyltransferase